MGNGVTGPTNTPANTPINSGTSAREAATAQAEFGEALTREQCPPGLHRPSRFEPPCNYLRPPGQEPPKPDQPVGIPRWQGTDVPKSPISTTPPADDYKKPTPKLEKKDPELPPLKHDEGLGKDQGGHIISVEKKQDWGQK